MARRRASFGGSLDARTLSRVADRLAEEGDARIAWRISGAVDAAGHPALEIALDGGVPLVCQRCLGAFDWPVAQRTVVLLARDERRLAQLDADDEHEVVLASAPLDASTLAEDELLLTLPFAPRCERAGCVAGSVPATAPPPGRGSAFASLAGLKPDPAKPRKR